MKIYTKSGDKGETSLFRGGRVRKDSLRVNSYGEIDELNSWIGWVRAQGPCQDVDVVLSRIQNDLFVVGSDLATPYGEDEENSRIIRLPDGAEVFMEEAIDKMEAQLEPLKNFILPGGSEMSAALHFARTIARRAERSIVAILNSGNTVNTKEEKVNPAILKYINRLSDLLFVMARYENKIAGTSDIEWKKNHIA